MAPLAGTPTRGQGVVSLGGEKTERDGRRQVPRTADLNRLKQQLTVATTSVAHRVGQIQRFIGGFTYNQSLTRHFDTSMDRPLGAILETARYILHGMYHVRCAEAVFAGIALTQQLRDVDRITLRFKSHIPSLDQIYRHIVLAVRVPSATPGAEPVWGAIGLSREPTLMNKPCRFNSLQELIEDFVKGYNGCSPSHNVMSVSVGLPVSHDDWCSAPVCWGYMTVFPRLEFAEQNKRALEEHVDPANTSVLIPLWEKYGRLRVAQPTRRLLTPGGPAERQQQGSGQQMQAEDRDWIDEVVSSVKAHLKLGPAPAVLHNRDGSVRRPTSTAASAATGGIRSTPPRGRGPSASHNNFMLLSSSSPASSSSPSPTRVRSESARITPPSPGQGARGGGSRAAGKKTPPSPSGSFPPVLGSINSSIERRKQERNPLKHAIGGRGHTGGGLPTSACSDDGSGSGSATTSPASGSGSAGGSFATSGTLLSRSSSTSSKRPRKPAGEPLSPLRAPVRRRSNSLHMQGGSGSGAAAAVAVGPSATSRNPTRKPLDTGGGGGGGGSGGGMQHHRVAATAAGAMLMQQAQGYRRVDATGGGGSGSSSRRRQQQR